MTKATTVAEIRPRRPVRILPDAHAVNAGGGDGWGGGGGGGEGKAYFSYE